MGILGSFPLTQSSYTTNPVAGGRNFFEFNNQTIYFNLNREEDYRRAYLSCAPLKAVVNRRAQMFVNGKFKLLNKNNDNELRGSFAADFLKLMDRPNILQSYKQFKAQQNIYIDLFGYCPVLKVTPIGMPGSVKSMWNLPPWIFEIEFTKAWYNQTDLKGIYKQFYLNWDGSKRPLDMDSVFLILDNSIGTDSDSNLLMPDSRLKSLEYAISNEIASKMAANTLLTKKGAIGILSKDNSGGQFAPAVLDPKSKDQLQTDFKRYGLTGQDFQVIITDAALKWQNMSSPIKDLMLFETMSASQADICDGMGMYPYLMTHKLGAGATFANLNEAKKSQYQDFIIPDDESRTEQLSNNLIPDEEHAYMQVDYSHIEVLQKSEQDKALALQANANAQGTLWNLGVATKNDIRVALKMDKVADPSFDQYNPNTTFNNPSNEPTSQN